VKKKVTRELYQFSAYNFEGTIPEVIERLKAELKQYGPTARFDWRPNFYYDYDNNPSPTFVIVREELETDAEYESRMKKEAELAAKTAERERKEFERLKAKFGSVS
jgi:hypothetical protein